MYSEQLKEVNLLYKVLQSHKIYDIQIYYTKAGNLIAKDDSNKWKNKEFYDFLFDEVLMFNNDNTLDLVNSEDLEELKKYKLKHILGRANAMSLINIINQYKDIKLETDKNKMIITFYKNDKVYKTLTIRRHKNNFKVLILPNNITKVIKTEELEDLILSIEKQKTPVKLDVAEIKNKYKAGMKIRLIKMYDYIAPISPLTTGFIEHIDDIGTLHILWEDGKRLGLIPGVDEFEVICPVCNTKLVKVKNYYLCPNCNEIGEKKSNICPICKNKIIGRPALSRKDNKTKICSQCGMNEALEQFIKYNKEK